MCQALYDSKATLTMKETAKYIITDTLPRTLMGKLRPRLQMSKLRLRDDAGEMW